MEYSLTFSSLSVDFLYPHYCLLKVKFSEVMREGGGGGGGGGGGHKSCDLCYKLTTLITFTKLFSFRCNCKEQGATDNDRVG